MEQCEHLEFKTSVEIEMAKLWYQMSQLFNVIFFQINTLFLDGDVMLNYAV